MHLTEENTKYFANEEARDKVYAEWRRYWNVTKPILVEKSPRHMLMTRLLQYWFTPEHTFFVVVMRHPLATMEVAWTMPKRRNFTDCGEFAIKHWLFIHNKLFEDLPYLNNVVLFQFERLATGNADRLFYSDLATIVC